LTDVDATETFPFMLDQLPNFPKLSFVSGGTDSWDSRQPTELLVRLNAVARTPANFVWAATVHSGTIPPHQ